MDLVVSSTLLALAALSLVWFIVLARLAHVAPREKAGGSVLMAGSIVDYFYWVIDPVVRFLAALGVTPHQVTGLSLALGMTAAVSLGLGHFGVAGLLLIASSVCDGMDGQLARLQGSDSISGAVFDSTADRYNEIFTVAGLAFFLRHSEPLLLLSLAALAGALMVSYASAKAEAFQVAAPRGAMRRGERAMYLSIGVVLVPVASALSGVPIVAPSLALAPVVIALMLIALVGNISAVRRFRAVVRAVEARTSAPDAVTASRAARAGAAAPQRPVAWLTLIRHQLAALGATAVDFAVMFVLVELGMASPSVATLLGASVGASTNFTLGRRYTFPGAQGSVVGQVVRYSLVAGASALLNAVGVWALGRLGVPYGGARLATALVVSVAWNFPMHRAFVFGAGVEGASASSASCDRRAPLEARVRP